MALIVLSLHASFPAGLLAFLSFVALWLSAQSFFQLETFYRFFSRFLLLLYNYPLIVFSILVPIIDCSEVYYASLCQYVLPPPNGSELTLSSWAKDPLLTLKNDSCHQPCYVFFQNKYHTASLSSFIYFNNPRCYEQTLILIWLELNLSFLLYNLRLTLRTPSGFCRCACYSIIRIYTCKFILLIL